MGNKKDQVKQELQPAMEVASKEELSSFKVKDSHFNKVKTYIDRKSKQEKTMDADWRNININGLQMVVYKGQLLTKKQFRAFEVSKSDLDFEKERKQDQQKFWLEKVETKSSSNEPIVIPEGEPSEAWTKGQLIEFGKVNFPNLKLAKNSNVSTLLDKLKEAKEEKEAEEEQD